MSIVIFVRHGQSETNLNMMLSNSKTGYPLTALGVSQAEAAAAELRRIPRPDRLFVSPLLRAIQTAEIISKAIGSRPRVDGRITERGFGSFDGKKFESKEMMREYVADEIRSNYSRGMESWDSLKGRMGDFMDALPKGTVSLAVSHYDPIRAAVACIDAKYDDDLMPNSQAPIPNSSITIMDVSGRRLIAIGKSGIEVNLSPSK
ncbi:MAG: histidine phosphatase family protein [Candidatus Micrarchaeota archaeon]|nr:histidine phosphatase family protein [Candidatus Micrarchaeota archaeon]